MNEAEPNQVTEPVESPEQAAVSEPPAELKKKAGKGNICLHPVCALYREAQLLLQTVARGAST